MRGLGLFLAIVLAAALGWVGAWALYARPAVPVSAATPVAAGDTAWVAGARALADSLRASEEDALRRPQTPRYQVHLDRARALGIAPVRSDAELMRHVRAGRLVPLVDNDLWTVKVLEHSSPFVTPQTLALLEETARRFQAALAERGLPPYRFTISSALRTAASQADLREDNANAASGASSHEYGTCVDIVYTKYGAPTAAPAPLPPTGSAAGDATLAELQAFGAEAGGARYWEHLAGLLGRVMIDMQRERKWVVLLEVRQPVFHVTMWNPR